MFKKNHNIHISIAYCLIFCTWNCASKIYTTDITIATTDAPISQANFLFLPTTNLAYETSNNTSASPNFLTDWNLTTKVNPSDWEFGNVSKISIRTLLYPNSTTRIFAHFMGFFDDKIHKKIGYLSTDPNQVHRQVEDMISRGIIGAFIDWNGPGTVSDKTLLLLQNETNKKNGLFNFGVVIDGGACAKQQQTTEIYESCLGNQINYVVNNYTNDAYYIKNLSDGYPVILFFLYNMNFSWSNILTNIKSNIAIVSTGNFNKVTNQPQQDQGAFTWVYPTSTKSPYDNLAWYYSNFLTKYPKEIAFGAVYKGFNDSPVNGWTTNPCNSRYLPQDCGQTWLSTFNAINTNFSASNQLENMHLVTWNDYEEGTELETGIDNCLTIQAAYQNNQGYPTLTWSFSGNGNINTVDHVTIFLSDDGNQLMPVANLPAYPTTPYSIDLLKLKSGTWYFYVQAVGKPSILNHMSNQVEYQNK